MVLYKRKPVQFKPVPDVQDDDEVWHIKKTGEIFDNYQSYLDRLEFYRKPRFNCTITGHSGLSFFEALESEMVGAREVEQAFPEALKGPILRRVQFQTTSRIDALVDLIFDEFKNEYFPGEAVTVQVNGQRLRGVVRDKAQHGSNPLPDGTIPPRITRYFVSLDEREHEDAFVDDTHIFRDRNVFTKSVLRSFIKKTVSREAWNGAPWLVKQDVAAMYRIDTNVPPHLLYNTKLQERKQLQAAKRLSLPDYSSANGSPTGNGPLRLPELKPAPKSHKSKAHQALQAQKGPLSFGQPASPPSIPPPPPPKYPIEDLQLELRGRVRPKLAYLCSDPPQTVNGNKNAPVQTEILMKSVGPLLETWDTLNVYCEIFKLDSFTFDDFVEAMQVASEECPVELFDEIHCAVLKILVSAEADGGQVQIELPDLETDDEDEDEDGDESQAVSPEPEPQPTARSTRGSLAKREAERLAAEVAQAEKEIQDALEAPKHRAEDALEEYDWVEHLSKRDLSDGGWHLIMVGLLYQLSKSERHAAKCEELLQKIVPVAVDPTKETVREHYMSLDVNLRVQALQIICMLTVGTKAVRGYMEVCSENMTGYRKDKIEWQRKRKQGVEELKALNEQRKALLPDNMPPSPPSEAVKTNGDAETPEPQDITVEGSDDVMDTEDDNFNRKLRRGQDRVAERKRKEKAEQRRKEEAEAAAKLPKQSKQFIKLLKDIQKKEEEVKECEEEVAIIDNDLREADCPRTRVLGKDRFWNRYYWFERNGMPYGGLPDSSTAIADYANGCIWVQGPDDLEREGYIDMVAEYQDEYKAKFDMTVPERKALEEGPTSVFNATQWGYISEPDDVLALIEWLDPRGYNEAKLRKELVAFREKITKNMENRKQYLASASEDADKADKEEEVPNKRMSTRGRTAPITPEPPNYRCLGWKNTTAIEELGRRHSEAPPPPPTRQRKQTKKRDSGVVAPDPEPVTTRAKKARR